MSAGCAIGVLLYVNRSGSTLLSRLVSDRCEDVFVFPELRFPVDLLLAAHAGRPITGNALFRLIEGDPRRAALDVSASRMAEICAQSGGDVAALLRAIAAAAHGGRVAAILLKHEAFAWLAPAIADTLGAVRYLHIVRDPRAVVSSMLRTPVPEKPGFDMARGSPLFAARHWRRYLRRVDALAAQRPVTELRYEDLARDGGASACARVADALGVVPRGDDGGSRYRVAPLDRRLHPGIHDPVDAARGEGWRTELTPRTLGLVEATCGVTMRARGYAPAARARVPGWAGLAAANLRHTIATARHAGRTARHYLRRPDAWRALRARFALFLQARWG